MGFSCSSPQCHRLQARLSQKAIEGPPKFDVEDGIDDRIEETVDVAEPDGEREQTEVDLTDGDHLEQIVTHTYGVDNIQREEWHPT